MIASSRFVYCAFKNGRLIIPGRMPISDDIMITETMGSFCSTSGYFLPYKQETLSLVAALRAYAHGAFLQEHLKEFDHHLQTLLENYPQRAKEGKLYKKIADQVMKDMVELYGVYVDRLDTFKDHAAIRLRDFTFELTEFRFERKDGIMGCQSKIVTLLPAAEWFVANCTCDDPHHEALSIAMSAAEDEMDLVNHLSSLNIMKHARVIDFAKLVTTASMTQTDLANQIKDTVAKAFNNAVGRVLFNLKLKPLTEKKEPVCR